METTSSHDLELIAKHLKLDSVSVSRTAELLDEGNTIPFITRFRKDQIGGLDEQQIRAIQKELSRAKLLSERKETILKSIESRGKLSDQLRKQVRSARTMAALEDIYLPYKPKKQSLASIARSRGLEPAATEIIQQAEASPTLDERATMLVNEANELANNDAVLEGLQHLIAEHFGSHPKLRAHVRSYMWRTGKIVSKKIDQPDDASEDNAVAGGNADANAAESNVTSDVKETATAEGTPAEASSPVEAPDSQNLESAAAESPAAKPESVSESPSTEATRDSLTAESAEANAASDPPAEVAATGEAVSPAAPSDAPATEAPASEAAETMTPVAKTKDKDGKAKEGKDKEGKGGKKETISRRDQRREMRRKRRERLVQSFKDYFDYSDPIGKLPHHRILAINRGERTKVLRVKIECAEWSKFQAETESKFVQEDHPHAAFLKKCLQDAMGRLLVPSIEREVRRELNDRAEEHAVKVFARNLRKLLLQPPLRQHRVVAIDPGFRNGCKLAALDEFGQILGHDFINLLGNDKQKSEGRAGLVAFVKQHGATVIAIGNGAACRETEALVANVLSKELQDAEVGYLIVNEAGTSVYSTSDLGREELPDFDASARSAVSIGRRSLDPLSELVKIDPASIGVGLYQHDVKAKHLRESLDAVVESCVNHVGVDVNSASPSLLRYVSGLNALTARKIYQHRQQHGPFKNRQQLMEVNGIGESTYVQAAGFLKITDGENLLDATWIHPESYDTASRVLEAIGFSVNDLTKTHPSESPAAGSPSSGVTEQPAADTAKTQTPVVETAEVASPTTVEEVKTVDVESPAPQTPPDVAAPEAATAEQDSEAPAVDALGTEAPVSSVGDSSTPPVEPAEVATATEECVTPAEDGVAESTAVAVEIAAVVAEGSEAAKSDSGVVATATPQVTPPPPRPRVRIACSPALAEKLSTIDSVELAEKLSVGKLLLRDILKSLERPGRDPREDLPPPVFRRGILKLEDLKPEMEMTGTVLNVVDFGAFVDIGLVDSGLIHVSRLADRFVSDPHDVVSVGDILRVWVVEVDQKRRRVSLTAIEPGTEKPKPAKEVRKPRERSRGKKPEGSAPAGGKPKRFRGKGDRKPTHYKPKSAPKPVVPITKEMEEGDAPMRTFGDLKQLFEKRKRGGSK